MSASIPALTITRNKRPFALPASKEIVAPFAIISADFSGLNGSFKCFAIKLAVPEGRSVIGTPGMVRLVNSAAVPSPPTPTKAWSRSSLNSSFAR